MEICNLPKNYPEFIYITEQLRSENLGEKVELHKTTYENASQARNQTRKTFPFLDGGSN